MGKLWSSLDPPRREGFIHVLYGTQMAVEVYLRSRIVQIPSDRNKEHSLVGIRHEVQASFDLQSTHFRTTQMGMR